MLRDTCGRKKLLPYLLLCLAALLASANEAAARTWYIKADGTGDAPTIQAGVDAASAADIVLVAAGVYPTTSTVTINGASKKVCVAIGKGVKLVSESGPASTTIGSATTDVAIYVHDVGGAEISGFSVRTVPAAYGCLDNLRSNPVKIVPPSLPRGIECRNANVAIDGNQITDNGVGIELFGSPAQINGNTITGAYVGIGCYEASNATVDSNVIHDCGNLIDSSASSPTISDNDLYGGCAAVSSVSSSSPTITGNQIHNNYYVAISCSEATIENNRFSDNVGANGIQMDGVQGTAVVRGNIFYNQGLWALGLSDDIGSVVVEANTFDNVGSVAIFCQAGSNPIIRRNMIVHAPAGIVCKISSFPTMQCNNIYSVTTLYGGDCPDQTGTNGNLSVNPQFCGVPGANNHFLQSDSPCAPGNHPNGYDCGGPIGALGVGCGAVSTKATSWGAVKALYKN